MAQNTNMDLLVFGNRKNDEENYIDINKWHTTVKSSPQFSRNRAQLKQAVVMRLIMADRTLGAPRTIIIINIAAMVSQMAVVGTV